MNIYETLPIDQYEDGWSLRLTTQKGVRYIDISPGEPEDMCIARDLNDVLLIKDLLVMAYEAGKAGEFLTVETHKGEEEDE